MADVPPWQVPLTLGPIALQVEQFAAAVSIRCFKQDQAFGSQFKRIFGIAPPETGAAVMLREVTGTVALWSRPTEILLVSPAAIRDLAPAAELESSVGYVADLDCQYALIRCAGRQVPDMLSRMGGGNTCPLLGQAKRARLADVPAMVFSCLADQYTIMLDRSVLEHFFAYAKQVCSNL